MRMKSKPRQS